MASQHNGCDPSNLFVKAMNDVRVGGLSIRKSATVLMVYKSTTFNSFEQGSKLFFPSLFFCLVKSFPILCEI